MALITRCDLNDVLQRTEFYNVNNKDPRPADYDTNLRLFHTDQWINLFHTGVPIITLDAEDVKWMKKAAETVGVITGRHSKLFDDELDRTYQKHIGSVPDCPPEGWFIRCERVSLKGGMYGIGPYYDFRKILMSMVSSNLGHECITHREVADGSCRIYFMKWHELDPEKEFRVFVHNNRITGISQQHLYTVNDWLRMQSENENRAVVEFIVDNFNRSIQDKLCFLGGSYTMDYVIINDVGYFIEVNSFGAHYAAGSALFNWTVDHNQLHSTGPVELRFVATE